MFRNQIKSKTVQTLRLANGEEVVAEVLGIHSDSLELREPKALVMTQNGLAMMPMIMSAREGEPVVVQFTAIAAVAVTDPRVESKYREAVSGLDLSAAPTPSILMS